MLFRPGHYDLLIPRNWSEPALIEPDGERLVLPQQPPRRPPPTQACSSCYDTHLAGCWLCGEGVCTKQKCSLRKYDLPHDLGGGICCLRCFMRFPRYNHATATNPPPPRSDTHTLWSCDVCEQLNFPSRVREHACRMPTSALPTRTASAPASAGEDESGGSRAGVGVAAETSGDGNGTRAVVAAVGAGLADSAPVEVIVTAFDPHHIEHGYEGNFFGLSCNDASKVVTPEGVGPCIVKFDEGKFAKVSAVTHEMEHDGSKTGQKYVYIEPYEADHDGRPLRSLDRDGALRSLNRDGALRAGAKLTFFVPNVAPASPPDAFAAQRLHENLERLARAGYAKRDCKQALRMCGNNYEDAARFLQDSRECERLRMCEDDYERAAIVLQDSRECDRPQNPMSAAVQDVAEAAVGAAQGMATTVSAAVQGVAKAAVGAAQGVVGAAQGMATTVAGAARMGVGAVVGNQSNQSFETDGAAVGAEHLAQQEQASADAVHQLAAEEYDLQQRERLGDFLARIRNDRHPDLHPDHARLAIRAQRTLYAGEVAQTEAALLDRRFAAFGLAIEAKFIPQEIEAIAAGAWPPHEYICKYCRRRFRTLEGQRWHEGSDTLSFQLNECVDWKKRGRLWAETYDKRNPQWAV